MIVNFNEQPFKLWDKDALRIKQELVLHERNYGPSAKNVCPTAARQNLLRIESIAKECAILETFPDG